MTILGGLVGGAVNVAGSVVNTAVNVVDTVVVELAKFALGEHCKRTGLNLTFVGVVDVNVIEQANGKVYELTVKAVAQVNNIGVVKILWIRVFVPFLGLSMVQEVRYEEDINI